MTVRRRSSLLRCRCIGGLFKDTKEENERRKKDRNAGGEEMGKETLPRGANLIPSDSSLNAECKENMLLVTRRDQVVSVRCLRTTPRGGRWALVT